MRWLFAMLLLIVVKKRILEFGTVIIHSSVIIGSQLSQPFVIIFQLSQIQNDFHFIFIRQSDPLTTCHREWHKIGNS